MVANIPKMQQHLVSHLIRADGDLTRTYASHQSGSTNPLAIVSRVHNMWARKRVFKLDAGCPKSKCNKTAQQPAAGQAGHSAEPEAVPFTKPKAKGTKLGSRQQVKAAAADAAHKANISATNNSIPDAKLQAARSSPKCPSPQTFRSASSAANAEIRRRSKGISGSENVRVTSCSGQTCSGVLCRLRVVRYLSRQHSVILSSESLPISDGGGVGQSDLKSIAIC